MESIIGKEIKKTGTHRRKRIFTKNKFGIPGYIAAIFKNDDAKMEIFSKKIHNLEKGRHILELSPIYIRGLQHGLCSKKEALNNIFGLDEANRLDFTELAPREINQLCEYLYRLLYTGMERILKELDFNGYLSVDKVINSGNAMKNYNGSILYGGITIRNYLTHTAKNEFPVPITEQDKDIQNKRINEFVNSLESFSQIKSFPFSIFRYKDHIVLDENNKLITPDIEAKYNLKRILGREMYNALKVKNITTYDATYMESLLIEKIKKITKREIKLIVGKYISEIKDEAVINEILSASELNSIIAVTNHGLIHEIVRLLDNNINNIITAGENPERVLTEEEKKSFFQIAYQSLQKNTVSPDDDDIWISKFGCALRSNSVNYNFMKLLFKYHTMPQRDEMSITDWMDVSGTRLSYDELENIFNTEI